jgi:hypothetical protein
VQDGPFLSITLLPDGSVAAGKSVDPGSVALALGGLPTEELAHLRENLTAATDAAVRKAVPLLFDLDDDSESGKPADDPLRQTLPDVPALTAAASVLGSPWSAPGISVEIGPSCLAAATRCVPLFSPPGDDRLVRRARGLSWALSNAAIVRASAETRPAILSALREKQRSGNVALIFTSSRGTLDEEQLALLRAQAKRALTHLPPNAPQRAWLEIAGNAKASWSLPVALGPDEILVVPRLSASARLPRFEADLVESGVTDWVVRPGKGRLSTPSR